MLAHRIPPEAKLQPDLDVGAALGVELLSTPEVVVREASLAAGWLLGLAARSADGGLSDTDLDSDLAGRHAGGLKTQDLLLLRRADRTAGRLADTASRRGLARFCRRRYAGQVRSRNHLSHNEVPTESEPRQPLFGLMLPRRTDFSSRGRQGLCALTSGIVFFACSDAWRFYRLVPRHR